MTPNRLAPLFLSTISALVGCRTPPQVVVHGTAEEVEGAIQKGLDVHHRDPKTDATPLMLAVESNPTPVEVVDLLLRAGASAQAGDALGSTALHRAMERKEFALPLARLLLDHGADVNAAKSPRADRTTALHLAAKGGKNLLPVTALLLDRGASPNALDSRNRSPLHYVVEHHPRESELLRLLVARGAEVNGPNPRPPLTAAQSEENIRTLIELGAKVDAHGPSAEDYSALQLAVMLHRREAAKTLLEAGANPNLNTYYPGFVPLPYREKPSRKYVAHEWMSPLHGAVADGDLNMVELLLKHHARTDMDSTHWGYPLDFAIFLEKWDISESLVAHGAKASLAHLQLDLAIRKHNLKQVQFCLRMGADPNRPDPSFQDQTPLHTAALADNLEAARMLLKAGAQCNRTNREGRRPVDLAISPTMRALLSPPGP